MRQSSIFAHFIEEEGGLFARRLVTTVPRVGDELRFTGDRYFKVTLVVWVYDEPDCSYERVNVGMVPTELGK